MEALRDKLAALENEISGGTKTSGIQGIVP